MSEIPSQLPPMVAKKTVQPPGVLPRNIQSWVLGGIALLMVLVIALSGSQEPKRSTAPNPALSATATDPSKERIEEYRVRIEEQANKLAAEQARLQAVQQNLEAAAEPPPTSAPRYAGPSRQTARSRSDPLEAERKRRQYESLFASNVSLTYRGLDASERPTPRTGGAVQLASHSPAGQQSATASSTDSDAAQVSPKRYPLWEGTIIETVLTNRLDGEFSGPVNCMVTTNVYSRDRRRLLIPQGSRVLGEVRRVDRFGQQRLAVVFHRLLLLNGVAVSLDEHPGLNQIGETGLKDKINRHYLQIFGASIAIGAIAGFGQLNTRAGFDASGTDAYVQGVNASLSQSSLRILDRFLNVLPTFTISEGHRVKVYLSADLLLPAYEDPLASNGH